MNMNWKRAVKIGVMAATCAMPALGLADGVEAMNEVATEIDKMEVGVKAVGGAVVGLTLLGSGYMLAKRWAKRI